MKITILFSLLLVTCGAVAQNEISTPTGQSLKVVTDTLEVNGNFRINNGILKLNNYKFLSTAGDRNIFVGNSGNASLSGLGNSIIGFNSGIALTSGSRNTFIGSSTGQVTTTGSYNSFIGYATGFENTTGNFNTFIGNSAGNQNATGDYNVMLGNETGSLSLGSYNTYIGRTAGAYNTAGNFNTFIGYSSGDQAEGSNNVFIGAYAGRYELGNNKLYIANSETATPLVYGDFAQSQLVLNGKVGISTSSFPTSMGSNNTSAYKLFVKGGILTEQITVVSGWADYVFEQGYKLKPLSEVEQFIKQNGHLPNVPSAKQIETDGLNLGNIAVIQQEKIEELTLYTIDQEKRSNKNSDLIKNQQSQIDEIMTQLESLKSKLR